MPPPRGLDEGLRVGEKSILELYDLATEARAQALAAAGRQQALRTLALWRLHQDGMDCKAISRLTGEPYMNVYRMVKRATTEAEGL